jgi:hypothetical protein
VYIPGVLDQPFAEVSDNVFLVHPREVLVTNGSHVFSVTDKQYVVMPHLSDAAVPEHKRCTLRAVYTPYMRRLFPSTEFVERYIDAVVDNTNQYLSKDHPNVRLVTAVSIQPSDIELDSVESALEALRQTATASVCATVLFSVNPVISGTQKILGATYLGGGCNPPLNVMIVSGKTVLEAAVVLQHEIGHLYNAPHPAEECAAEFPKHIMAPFVSTETVRRFEQCSLSDIVDWLAGAPDSSDCWTANGTTPRSPTQPLIWPYLVSAAGLFCVFFIFVVVNEKQ